MVEYIYDTVRATSGENFTICAVITDDDDVAITDNCYLALLDEDFTELCKTYGAYDGEQWDFTVPDYITQGHTGRHWYKIGRNDIDLCFRTALYLV